MAHGENVANQNTEPDNLKQLKLRHKSLLWPSLQWRNPLHFMVEKTKMLAAGYNVLLFTSLTEKINPDRDQAAFLNQLALHLTDPAETFYYNLPSTVQASYDALKDAQRNVSLLYIAISDSDKQSPDDAKNLTNQLKTF